jgi:hypothetical protein
MSDHLKLFSFVTETLAGDVCPVLLRYRKFAETYEVEFRWKRAHNSPNDNIRFFYDIGRDEWKMSRDAFAAACVIKGIQPHKFGNEAREA